MRSVDEEFKSRGAFMRFLTLTFLVLLGFSVSQAQAHCQIPCGIYDDARQFKELKEHVTTIEKSMREINELSALDKPDIHKITRWTINKEEHAQKIQDIISSYFLTQRVKLPKEDTNQQNYVDHVTKLHAILVAAMKTKQKLDLSTIDVLNKAITDYENHYFKKHGHKH